MSIVKGRHIRHDWRTFNDRQDQNSVRTLCGVTSTPKASGIPTVTDQKAWIIDNEKDEQFWGWCWRCTLAIMKCHDDLEHAHTYVQEMYNELLTNFIDPAFAAQKVFHRGDRTSYFKTPTFKIDRAVLEDTNNPHPPS